MKNLIFNGFAEAVSKLGLIPRTRVTKSTSLGKKAKWQLEPTAAQRAGVASVVLRGARSRRIGGNMTNRAWKRQMAGFVGILCIGGTTVFADLNTGLVAHYPLNGNASDATGNGHNGVVLGALSVADQFGNPGGALSFDATTAKFVIVTNFPGFPSNAVTVSFWMQTADSSDRCMFSYATGNNASQRDNMLTIQRPNAVVAYFAYSGYVETGVSANDGTWKHIVVTWRSTDGEFRLFKNAISQGTWTRATGGVIDNGGCLVLGQEQDTVGDGFSQSQAYIGALDDVRIYDRALSAAEIQELYSLSAPTLTVSNLQGSQRTTAGLVDVYYTLTSTNSGTSTVSVQVSTNGGASYNISPTAGALSGDIGAGISLGPRKLTWDAAQNLPSSYSGNNVKVRLTASGVLGTTTHTSSSFAVDLAGLTRSISVNGRVLNSQTRAALPGATVNLAGQTTATGSDGKFAFSSVSLTSGSTLTVSKSGYATYSGTVAVPANATAVSVSDVLLQAAPAGSQPIVTKVEPRLKGLFLFGVALNNDFTASINWNGVAPGSVRFSVNGTLVSALSGTGTEFTATLNMGANPFRPGFNLAGNVVTVEAVGSGGQTSSPYNVYVGILPIPDPIKVITAQGFPFTTYLEGHVGLDFDLPNPPLEAVLTLPVIGKFGVEVAANASFDYTVTDGDWEAAIGVGAEKRLGKSGRRPNIPGLTRYPKMKLYVGNKELSGKIEAGARGTATIQNGITFDEVFGHGEINAKLELGRFGLLDLMGPGLSSSVGAIPGLGDATKAVSVIIYAIPGIDGEIAFALDPRFAFDSLELTGKVGLEAAYEPDLGVAELRLYVGGEPSVTFGYPGDLFRKVRFKAYAGAEFDAWIFSIGPIEYVFVDITLPSGAGALPLATIPLADGETVQVVRLKAISDRGQELRLRSRGYLERGPEQFVALESRLARGKSGQVSTLTDFRRMGQGTDKSAKAKATGQGRIEPEDGPLPMSDQADLALVENVYPGSEPAMASKGQELMLLYVTDNGSSNTLQCTDIRWTHYDGTNWSAPATIHTNTQAEFAPQVAFDGNGDAIAVWERVADPDFNTADLAAMAAQMEIVWSKWNHMNGQWAEPQTLTADTYLDHAPQICGPMTDGTVLALWTANTNNLLMGTNGAGSQVLWVQWSPTSQTWSVPQTLLPDLPNRLSQSLSGVSNRAVYVWTRDLDGVLTNANDQQVFYCQYQSGGWASVSQLTSSTNGNRSARAAVSGVGDAVGVISEGFESGAMSGWPWTSTGNAAWVAQTSVVNSGAFAAASGTIGNSQTSGMVVTQSCVVGNVSFAYKVSSESNYDYLRFYIDGQQQGAWSGAVGWATNSYAVTAGVHFFEWRYTKDNSQSSGSDKAWVDEISLPTVLPSGVNIVWQQGTNLVLSRNFSATTTVVRTDSQTAGFADYALTIGPGGNLALLWQEMSQTGSDAHYRVLDPASATWSKDAQMFNDLPLERSFAPVWDDVGHLTVAYNKVQINYTNKTVTLEGGRTVTITNVPQPGRVDLCVTKRQLIKDVALNAGDFTVSAENYLPGAAVTLSATLRNVGDLAVSNAVVAFYDGNPTNSGVLITNVEIAGWLDGAAINTVNAVWVVPEPATNHILYAVADPAGVLTEFDEANNKQSLSIGGTDLAVSLVSQVAETNGEVRVIAQVQNVGAPSATNSLLAIRRIGSTNTPLATVEVPLLEPGRLAQVALDLPAGTQPEGEAVYTLRADEASVTSDVETNNNTTSFAVNLWIDSDGDGMPDSFESQYPFLSSSDANDALLDYDNDGLSNLAEYRAGTSLTDPFSYLRMTGIGSGGTNGVLVAWGSTTNRLYTLERTSSLLLPFGTVEQHILSTSPENVYVDSSATNGNQFFYRVRVE